MRAPAPPPSLQTKPWLFAALCDLLRKCPVWSINLGELRFSEEQCVRLGATLAASGVTHMFYECTVAGRWKDEFRGTPLPEQREARAQDTVQDSSETRVQ